MPQFVQVALNLPLHKLFIYRVPEHLGSRVLPGKRVKVPFGNRQYTGYIVEPADSAGIIETKDILEIIDEHPVVSPQLLELTKWISQYYHCPWGMCLAAAVPGDASAQRENPLKYIGLGKPPDQIQQALAQWPVKAVRQKAVLSLLLKHGEMEAGQLADKARAGSPTLHSLEQKGLIRRNLKLVWSKSAPKVNPVSSHMLLRPEQQEALDVITGGLSHNRFTPILLHGVTGSGKTEVYLQAIAHTLALGRKAIVLAPEISLTGQLFSRFQARFGSQVVMLHSQLGKGERHEQWRKLWQDEAGIVLGPRSAIFAPLSPLGLIVVDEEHDHSYKQEVTPRYNGRDVALKRGQLESAVVVLGSATPSLESYHNAKTGRYKLVELSKRVHQQPLPQVQLVDLRQAGTAASSESAASQQDNPLSPLLTRAIWERLNRREQSLILLNRRGYSNFIQCIRCGQVVRCLHCSVSLTYHKPVGAGLAPALGGRAQDPPLQIGENNGTACCHYCNYTIAPPGVCPSCHSPALSYKGLGIQRLESILSSLFPQARLGRLDRDTASRKGAGEKILSQMEAGKLDILLGTQMVAKGFDFPKITLVGVISADLTLNLPDFRSAERTFQLLTQVAGRAGRAHKPGQVIIQTYNPDHYSLQAARLHDYQQFYAQEMKFRQILHYPPMTRLANIIFQGKKRDNVRQSAQWLAEQLNNDRPKLFPDTLLLGPSPAVLNKIGGKYRWQIIAKGRYPTINLLLNRAVELFASCSSGGTKMEVDMDAMSLL